MSSESNNDRFPKRAGAGHTKQDVDSGASREAASTGPGTKEASEAFLVEEFGVETHEAAELVADDPAEAEKLAERDFERQRKKDPLEDVPAPQSPQEGPEERVQHHMHKHVRHEDDS